MAVEQIKRNSTEFKDVKKILDKHARLASRKKLILLYTLKPYETIKDKVLLNEQKKESTVLYDMSYRIILEYFNDNTKKLFREGKEALYYFKSSGKSKWIELPFEFTGKLKTQLFPLRIIS